MRPYQAVSTGLRKVMHFDERASRSEYWWMFAFAVFVMVAFQLALAPYFIDKTGVFSADPAQGLAAGYPLFLLMAASASCFNFLMLPTTARRFKDCGWNGGWFKVAACLNAVLGVTSILCTLLLATDQSNAASSLATIIFPLLFITYSSVIWCFWIGFVRPCPNSNIYGPNPHEVTP